MKFLFVPFGIVCLITGYMLAVYYDGPLARQHLIGFMCDAYGHDAIVMNDGSPHCANIELIKHNSEFVQEFIDNLQAGIDRNSID